jgi:hypothetical protein
LDWLHYSGLKAPSCPAGYPAQPTRLQLSLRAANGMIGVDGVVQLTFIPLTEDGDEAPCSSSRVCATVRVRVPTTWAWIWYTSTAAVPLTLSCGTTYRMRATFPEPYCNIESVTFALM